MKQETPYQKGFLKNQLGDYRVEPPEEIWGFIAARLRGRNKRMILLAALPAAAAIALAVTIGVRYFSTDLPADNGQLGQTDAPPVSLSEPPPSISGERAGETPEISEGNPSTEAAQSFETGKPSAGPAAEPTVAAAAGPAAEPTVATPFEALALGGPVRQSPAPGLLSGRLPGRMIPGAGSRDSIPGRIYASGEYRIYPDIRETGPGETGNTPRREGRWQLGAFLAPLYSYRDANTPTAPDHESGILAYSGGVRVGYRTSSRLALESGIYLNKMGISIGASGIRLAENEYDFSPIETDQNRSHVVAISNSIGNIVSNSGEIFINGYKVDFNSDGLVTSPDAREGIAADQGIRQEIQYVEFPVNLRYTMVDRDVEIQLMGGFSTNLLLDARVILESAGGNTEIGTVTNLKPVNYSANTGLGVVYHVFDRLNVYVEPRFRYFLNSVNDLTLPSTRPYSLGLYTGLNFTF